MVCDRILWTATCSQLVASSASLVRITRPSRSSPLMIRWDGTIKKRCSSSMVKHTFMSPYVTEVAPRRHALHLPLINPSIWPRTSSTAVRFNSSIGPVSALLRKSQNLNNACTDTMSSGAGCRYSAGIPCWHILVL